MFPRDEFDGFNAVNFCYKKQGRNARIRDINLSTSAYNIGKGETILRNVELKLVCFIKPIKSYCTFTFHIFPINI